MFTLFQIDLEWMMILSSNCQNCETNDVKTKVVSLLEYSSLKVKNKQEVNPEKRNVQFAYKVNCLNI